ncbi:MAG: ATP-dependent protease subunit HslV [Deltaproteobacteria bacterium]|nr:ATP-dependent protease subunit HslV [Deltaproteobacteria bacterium]
MQFHGTTILALRHAGVTAVGGDGQVSFGHTIVKKTAKKIRRLYNNQVLAGFAGSTADALTLFEKFEGKLEQFHGSLKKSSVALAKEWRTDRVLRRLEALMLVADNTEIYMLSGSGDVMKPDDDVIAIGSGGAYALAAARAFKLNPGHQMTAQTMCEASLKIASDICIYTNDKIEVQTI